MAQETLEQDVGPGARDDTRMPPVVRRIVFSVLAVVAGFAVYLFAVRGIAIVYDIGQLGARLLCL